MKQRLADRHRRGETCIIAHAASKEQAAAQRSWRTTDFPESASREDRQTGYFPRSYETCLRRCPGILTPADILYERYDGAMPNPLSRQQSCQRGSLFASENNDVRPSLADGDGMLL